MNKLQKNMDLNKEFATPAYEENFNLGNDMNVLTTDDDNENLNVSNSDIKFPSTCENYATNQDCFECDYNFNLQAITIISLLLKIFAIILIQT